MSTPRSIAAPFPLPAPVGESDVLTTLAGKPILGANGEKIGEVTEAGGGSLRMRIDKDAWNAMIDSAPPPVSIGYTVTDGE